MIRAFKRKPFMARQKQRAVMFKQSLYLIRESLIATGYSAHVRIRVGHSINLG